MNRTLHKYQYLILALFLAIFALPIVLSYVNSKSSQTNKTAAQEAPTMTVLAKNLEIPWALDFLPDGNIIFTERPGRVKLLNPTNGQITQIATIPGVRTGAEGGLLGIAVHPQFATNKYVYLYHTYESGGTFNKVVRYSLNNNQLAGATTLIEGIPGNNYHNGGRMRFGPDGYLYITTGDGNNTASPGNTGSLGGKILRVKDDGTAAPGNPFNNLVYSYGHRNPQGIAWDGNTMYATEHGPSQPSCCDEVNRIEIGKNYGWPDVTADQTKDGTVKNLLNSGNDSNNTWAPSGTAFYNGSIFFAGLRGQALYEVKVNGDTASIVTEHFKNELGRIRDVVVGPDNELYITTSNKSAQGGSAQPEDDKIIKLRFGNVTPPASPSPTIQPVSPTFTCLGTCLTDGPTLTTQPTVTDVMPTDTEPTTDPEPTIDPNQPTPTPCIEEDQEEVSIQHYRDRDGNDGMMGIFFKFLMLLLQLLSKLIGGDTLPTDPTDPGC